jgi:hypothetical protein
MDTKSSNIHNFLEYYYETRKQFLRGNNEKNTRIFNQLDNLYLMNLFIKSRDLTKKEYFDTVINLHRVFALNQPKQTLKGEQIKPNLKDNVSYISAKRDARFILNTNDFKEFQEKKTTRINPRTKIKSIIEVPVKKILKGYINTILINAQLISTTCNSKHIGEPAFKKVQKAFLLYTEKDYYNEDHMGFDHFFDVKGREFNIKEKELRFIKFDKEVSDNRYTLDEDTKKELFNNKFARHMLISYFSSKGLLIENVDVIPKELLENIISAKDQNNETSLIEDCMWYENNPLYLNDGFGIPLCFSSASWFYVKKHILYGKCTILSTWCNNQILVTDKEINEDAKKVMLLSLSKARKNYVALLVERLKEEHTDLKIDALAAREKLLEGTFSARNKKFVGNLVSTKVKLGFFVLIFIF